MGRMDLKKIIQLMYNFAAQLDTSLMLKILDSSLYILYKEYVYKMFAICTCYD